MGYGLHGTGFLNVVGRTASYFVPQCLLESCAGLRTKHEAHLLLYSGKLQCVCVRWLPYRQWLLR